MFSGIVEGALPIRRTRLQDGCLELYLEMPEECGGGGIRLGDSIALNGCCLTVAQEQTSASGQELCFQAVPETLERTNLGELQPGMFVNVERALKLGQGIDGHLVQGHVDSVGKLQAIQVRGGERRLWIEAGKDFCLSSIEKGSVCIDGISLTIAELEKDRLCVAIIPHTWEHTNLSSRKVGARLNLEADMIGKYVQKQLANIFGEKNREEAKQLNQAFLKEHGFH